MRQIFKSGGINKEQAIEHVRALREDMDMYDENPTLDREELRKIADFHDQLMEQHGITEEEIAGEVAPASKFLASGTPVTQLVLPVSDNAVDIYRSQAEHEQEMETYRANGMDREHHPALPFKVGYHLGTGEIDQQSLINEFEKRHKEFNPSLHQDMEPGAMDGLAEAYAAGMDLDQYKAAIKKGVPHEYLTYCHQKSLRPHMIQQEGLGNQLYPEYGDQLMGVNLGETLVGGAVHDKFEYDPWEENKGEKGMVPSQGFTPLRLEAIKPLQIAKAYLAGVKPQELLSAWHSNGFHPLRNHGSHFTYPISKYTSMREMGADHKEAAQLLSSLQYIPENEVSRALQDGQTVGELINDRNPYKDVSLEGPKPVKELVQP